MKIFFISFLLFLSSILYAQNPILITSKKTHFQKGYSFRLIHVFDDSRCPEQSICIWAGSVSVTLQVYKGKKSIEKKTLIFNPNNSDENIKWFVTYFTKKVENIEVLPYPKKELPIPRENYFLRIQFSE